MRARAALLPLIALILAPIVRAAPFDNLNISGISNTMAKLWDIVGAVINVQTQAQAAIMIKVFIFFLLFALTFYLLRQRFQDKKIAGTIAFAIAFLVAFLTPNSGLIFAVISIAIPLAIILGLCGLALYHDWFKGSFLKSIAGAFLILIALLVNLFLIEHISKWLSPVAEPFARMFMPVLDIITLALIFLFIGKLVSAFFNIDAGDLSKVGNIFKTKSKGEKELDKKQKENERKQRENEIKKKEADLAQERADIESRLKGAALQKPLTVSRIEFQEDPTNPAQVIVKWVANDPKENVLKYHVWFSEKQPPGEQDYIQIGSTTAPNITISSGVIPRDRKILIAVAAENANGVGLPGFSSFAEVKKTPSAPDEDTPRIHQIINNSLAEMQRGRATIDAAQATAVRLRTLVKDNQGKYQLDAIVPLVRPGQHPLWTEVQVAIGKLREGAVYLNNAGALLNDVSAEQKLPRSGALLERYAEACKQLSEEYAHASLVSASFTLAFGVEQ